MVDHQLDSNMTAILLPIT